MNKSDTVITICGSCAHFDGMLNAKKELEEMGYRVLLPMSEVEDENGEMISVVDYYHKRKTVTDENSWMWKRKAEAIQIHFDKIHLADAILVTNYEKNGIRGYIGGNTLIEMGIAFFLKIPIFLQFEIPEVSYKEEILAMGPILINNNISSIPSHLDKKD